MIVAKCARWSAVAAFIISYMVAGCDNRSAAQPSTTVNIETEDQNTEPSLVGKQSIDDLKKLDNEVTLELSIDEAFPFLGRALEGEFKGKRVTVAGGWSFAGADDMNKIFDAFETLTGLRVEYQSVPGIETAIYDMIALDDVPELLHLFQPGVVQELAEKGILVDLDSWMDVDQLYSDYSRSLVNIYSKNNKIYGFPFEIGLKSQVFYRPEQFRLQGFSVPETMAELDTLSRTIKARGLGSPWCVGTKAAGNGTGWVTTDWLEDLVLRYSSTELYDQWVSHEIPFNHETIVTAANKLADIWFSDGDVYGGIDGILNIEPSFAMRPFFSDNNPRCWMHKQARWVIDTWPSLVGSKVNVPEFGKDVAIFLLPPAKKTESVPLLVKSSAVAATTTAPEARAVLELLRTTEAFRSLIEQNRLLSPNRKTPINWYPAGYRVLAEGLFSAGDQLKYDASDLMPAVIGTDVFWREITDWVRTGGRTTLQTLTNIEIAWQHSEQNTNDR